MASHGHETTSSGEPPTPSSPNRNDELQKKRARDRKSQQAMRDRTKWQLQTLQEQVRYLTQVVGEKDELNGGLHNRLRLLEVEAEQLRDQNAALRLRLMRQSPAETDSDAIPRWQIPPSNIPPTCMADQIIQNFINSGRSGDGVPATSPGGHIAVFVDKPNLCALLDKDQRAEDILSNIVSDILLAYKEIATLPKQVAAFHGIATLLKWELLLDEHSWKQIPPYFRPIVEQVTTPHAAWIDRVPWPRVRRYFIQHPHITLDDFAGTYSTNFNINWPYEHSHVIIEMPPAEGGSRRVIANPVFEEQLQNIRNWFVTDAFRVRFPEISRLIDEEAT